MATIVHPDGGVEFFVDSSYERLKSTFKSGLFCVVGDPRSGYTGFVDDEGLLIGLPVNEIAMHIMQHYHSPLVGPLYIGSHEEMEETDLIGMIDKDLKHEFEQRMNRLLEHARKDLN
jgi:hypothetical protein